MRIIASLLFILFCSACDQSAGYHPPMSHTLTPVATFSTPLTVPDDGDACNAASVETPFQSLVNQTQVLFNGLLNVKVRPSLRSVNGTDIVIGAVPMIVGTEGGNWKALAYAGSTYTPAGLASGTWYYLYARITTGSITISHSTTSPDSFLRTMNGNTDYVFLGSFRTDGSGVIYPFFSRDGQALYAAQTTPAGSAPLTTALEAGEPTLGLIARARGRINPDGSLKRGLNIYNVSKTGTGVYVVELTWAPSHVDNFDVTLGSWESNPGAINYSGCVWYSPTIANGRISFTVECFVNTWANDQGFSFTAWGE